MKTHLLSANFISRVEQFLFRAEEAQLAAPPTASLSEQKDASHWKSDRPR